jgi:hypothetical protein
MLIVLKVIGLTIENSGIKSTNGLNGFDLFIDEFIVVRMVEGPLLSLLFIWYGRSHLYEKLCFVKFNNK